MTERFSEALAYADRLHREQIRKGSGVPYISHLLAVTALVIEHGGDEDEAIAAVLHDAVEDQGGAETLAEIRDRFGERVASIVDGCSDTDQIPKPPWKQRKLDYIAHLAQADRSVLLVSAADKLHNVRSTIEGHAAVGAEIWQRFNGGRDGMLWYYRAVADALREAGATPMQGSLDSAVSELEAAANNE